VHSVCNSAEEKILLCRSPGTHCKVSVIKKDGTTKITLPSGELREIPSTAIGIPGCINTTITTRKTTIAIPKGKVGVIAPYILKNRKKAGKSR
jgi:ribosomal protein L2